MKTLFLLLALTLQGPPPIQGIPGPFVKSGTIEIQLRDSEPLMLRSARAADGTYFLILDVPGSTIDQCEATFIVTEKHLTVPCYAHYSVTAGQRAGGYETQRLIIGSKRSEPVSSSKEIESVLKATAVEVEIGRYRFKLTEQSLRELSTVIN